MEMNHFPVLNTHHTDITISICAAAFTPTCLSIEVNCVYLAGPKTRHSDIIIGLYAASFSPSCLSNEMDHLAGPKTHHPEIVIDVLPVLVSKWKENFAGIPRGPPRDCRLCQYSNHRGSQASQGALQ